MVKVEILERNAIYVDGSRITNRNTKWGARNILTTFDCEENDVVHECIRRGFDTHVKCIDTEPYLTQAGKSWMAVYVPFGS